VFRAVRLLVSVTVAVIVRLFRLVDYRRLGGEHHPGYRPRIEHRRAGDLDGIDHAFGDQVAVGQDSVAAFNPRPCGSSATCSPLPSRDPHMSEDGFDGRQIRCNRSGQASILAIQRYVA
jgi:hypothetical protein